MCVCVAAAEAVRRESSTLIDGLRQEVARLQAVVDSAAADKVAQVSRLRASMETQASSIRASMEAQCSARERVLEAANTELRNTIAALEAKAAGKTQSRRNKVAKVRCPVHFPSPPPPPPPRWSR